MWDILTSFRIEMTAGTEPTKPTRVHRSWGELCFIPDFVAPLHIQWKDRESYRMLQA